MAQVVFEHFKRVIGRVHVSDLSLRRLIQPQAGMAMRGASKTFWFAIIVDHSAKPAPYIGDDPSTNTIVRRKTGDLGENHDPGRIFSFPA